MSNRFTAGVSSAQVCGMGLIVVIFWKVSSKLAYLWRITEKLYRIKDKVEKLSFVKLVGWCTPKAFLRQIAAAPPDGTGIGQC